MKKLIAFAGSNSLNSINKKFAIYTANQVNNTTVEILDLNDFNLPVYGIDYEIKHGIPNVAHQFLEKIKGADGIVLSLAEHNGAYATVFKNIFDWMSRIDGKLWSDVPMFLLATSPGGRGGVTVLDIAKGRFPFMGGNITATFSLPNFNDSFSPTGIVDDELKRRFEIELEKFEKSIQ
ncbi:FMN reductase [Patiriisocius marinistellae]|uniref:FMN reductase n=1 Tax=Patiriisocius marinistellae TaxID=2494560 RepID=A0A5J4FU96_9FLAO|nr:NAD(P)H-dependent oxidoreductase [Patiriisocius marinistellae]GEQ86207.1 FMN reductase [Patiriisocius marinistellae]